VQTFGREATPRERKQATAIISAWMRARAAKNWSKVCTYLSHAFSMEEIETAKWATEGKVKRCPEALVYFKAQFAGGYANNFGSGPVVSLRIGEGHGFAQYHGNDGKDWIVFVDREGGRWKVAVASPVDRNK
jgi:hypothetical protein